MIYTVSQLDLKYNGVCKMGLLSKVYNNIVSEKLLNFLRKQNTLILLFLMKYCYWYILPPIIIDVLPPIIIIRMFYNSLKCSWFPIQCIWT